MHQKQSSLEGSVGCGSLGCAGGLLLGLFGGGLLLILLSLGLALTGPVPSLAASANPNDPDLRLTLHENFLNHVVQDTMDETARLDLRPGNQLSVTSQAELSAFGVPTSVQVITVFELQLVGASLELQLLDVEVSGLNLPVDLNELFEEDLSLVNQDLRAAFDEMATALGRPIVLTGLSTDETNLTIEGREAP